MALEADMKPLHSWRGPSADVTGDLPLVWVRSVTGWGTPVTVGCWCGWGTIRGRCALLTTGFAGPSFVKGAFILPQNNVGSRFNLRIYSHTYLGDYFFQMFLFVSVSF